ncbi:MAG TPA: hypothetical protein VEK57_30300 [Thermoanaerobaculia bacterium]|nr:hypothetical protein [Thermoanaerobaculia bacterium]
MNEHREGAEWNPLVDVQENDSAIFIRFDVPDAVDAENVHAVYEKGNLEITVPKSFRSQLQAVATAAMQRLAEAMAPESVVPTPVQVLQAQRNAAAREEMLQEFGAFTSSNLAERAGSKAANKVALAHRWKTDGRIFSVTYRGTNYFPGFQFDEEGQPLAVMAELLRILAPARAPWEIALWFTGADGWLGGKRPVDLLLSAPERVVEAAKHEAAERVF